MLTLKSIMSIKIKSFDFQPKWCSCHLMVLHFTMNSRSKDLVINNQNFIHHSSRFLKFQKFHLKIWIENFYCFCIPFSTWFSFLMGLNSYLEQSFDTQYCSLTTQQPFCKQVFNWWFFSKNLIEQECKHMMQP